MKTISIFLVLFFFPVVDGICQFEWLSPIPTGNALTSSWFFNPDTGIIVGHDGDILNTYDGGESWEHFVIEDYPEWGYDFNAIMFTENNTGFITGTSGSIFKTTDGGLTWDLKYGCQNCEHFTDVFFRDSQLGWVAGKYGAFRKTTDGGETWISLSGFPLDQVDMHSIWFLNDGEGWAAAGGMIVRFSNGGNSWEFFSYQFGLYDVFFIDESTGWMCGSGGKVMRTIDGGINWNIFQSPVNVALMEIKFTDPLTGWAVGEDGTILKSEDGGQTWMQYVPVTGKALYSIFMAGDEVFYITGTGGTIIKSEDGGEFWEFPQENTIMDDLADIAFTDENTGWAVSYNGKIFKTTDGGNHWTLSFYFAYVQFTSVTSTDPSHCWAAGAYMYPGGVILGTENGGLDWTIQDEDVDQINDIMFTDAMHGWAVGFNGAIYHTADGGTQWNQQSSGAQNDLNSVFFLDNQNGLAGGYDEVVQTYNGGETWELQNTYPGDFWLIHKVFAFNPINRFASGDMNIYYADYEGNSWQTGSQNPAGVKDAAYYTPQYLWEAGTDGLLLKRSSTWDYYSITTNDLNALYFDLQHATGYVAGDFGTIIKIDLNYWVGTEEKEKQISSLKVDIFPNPAKEIVNCRFSVPNSQCVTLKIFDINGREMPVVYKGMESSANHHISFDVSGYVPGVYIYRLISSDETITGKLVVAR